MQFVIVLAVLFLVSLILAYRSLRHIIHMKEVGEVKKELHQGKILFKRD